MSERRKNLGQRVEFDRLRLNLLARLSVVCAHMPKSELDNLTRSMTRLRQKYSTTTALPSISEP